MFSFVLEVVGVSILVSIFGTWIKVIPRYPKWKYSFIQQFINIGIQTLFVTMLFSLGVYPSWLLLFAMIFFIVWLSVQFTNNIVREKGGSIVETAKKNDINDGTESH